MDRELTLTLERVGLRAMPPSESIALDGWRVAIGRGAVGRLNSCTAFGVSSRRDLFERIEAVERRYAGRGRESRFRLTRLDGHLDARLETRGYARSPETLVMTGPVGGDVDGSTRVTAAVGPAWLSRYGAWGDHDEVRVAEIGESLGSLTLDHGVFMTDAAIGVVVIDGPWAGVFDITVDPAARGLGHGRRLTSAMLAWAEQQGADRTYLQVLADNRAATGLYGFLGFEEAYRYWYRTEF